MSLLRAEKIVAGYGAQDEVLRGIDIAISPGEIVAILGPNGAGKSTLLKAIAGIVTPRSGAVELFGKNILGKAPREVSRLGISFVPQEFNIFPSLTVGENLEISAYLDRPNYTRRLTEVFNRMPGIAERRGAKGRTLSGGQRQLLAMAMALMVGPKLMLLDEPSAGLSPAAAEKLFAIIKDIRADGVSIAMVEQNALHALMIADRAYILVDGRNSRSGGAEDLLNNPDIRRIFLGEK